MSVLHPYPVQCVCKAEFEALLAESVNVGRMPNARDEILAGTFHRFTCPDCQREMTIEKEFQYTDLERNVFIKVKPPKMRHEWRETSQALDQDVDKVPASLLHDDGGTRRVVFGLGELREKLLAEEAGIDDRMVEVLKVLLINEHPVLLTRSRLRLQLNEINGQKFGFVANYEHNTKTFELELPRWQVDGVLERADEVAEWVDAKHGQGSIFSLTEDHWMNLWRWSPQVSALAVLERFAAEVRAGKRIKTTGMEFKLMLKFLPRGTQLPSWARRDAHEIFLHAQKRNLGKVQDALFELRFDIELEDDWARNDDPDDIATLWNLLRDLPDTNVEGNAKIREIYLAEGEGEGWYQPWSNDIYIGERALSSQERFEDVMRHEVGHAVHEQRLTTVDPWLTTRFGWQVFGKGNDEIDDWVELMGGWGDLTSTERAQVRGYLKQALGRKPSWDPGSTPSPPASHPWWGADFGPRLAFEQTGSSWYIRNHLWYRHNGKVFFLNYWYKAFMAIDVETLELINDKMPSRYAAMSHMEFFAELYALYYDLDDPKRDSVPGDVADWLEENIGPSEPAMPAVPFAPAPPPEPLPEWHWIERPGA